MKYGILIGRFQPLHLAHQSIINEILHDGLIPIIFIGSSNVLDNKNPLTYIQRANIIHSIYGESVITLPLPDNESDDEWFKFVLVSLYNIGINKNAVLYYCHKEGDPDLTDFYGSAFDIITPKHCLFDGEISATMIRNDPEANRKYIDGRVLKYLKDLKNDTISF